MKKLTVSVIIFLSLIICLAAVYVICAEPNNVLSYHLVLDEPYNEYESLFVRVSEFESQLIYLNEHGYESAFADEYGSGKIIITFDDGYEDNYTNVFPLLLKYNVKATIFVIASYIGSEGYLTAAQIKEMSDSGLVSIQSHSFSHSRLTELNDDELRSELADSADILYSITEKPVYAIAYPYGDFDKRVIDMAKEYYTTAFTTKAPNVLNIFKGGGNLAIPRMGVPRGCAADSFKKLVK